MVLCLEVRNYYLHCRHFSRHRFGEKRNVGSAWRFKSHANCRKRVLATAAKGMTLHRVEDSGSRLWRGTAAQVANLA